MNTIHPGHLKKGIPSDSRCMKDLRALNRPYPRTCEECGLGPCKRHPVAALSAAPAPKEASGPSDTEMLDWLEKHVICGDQYWTLERRPMFGETLRATITAAMRTKP